MMKSTRSFLNGRLLAGLILVLLSVGGVDAGERTESLRAALKGADRVVVEGVERRLGPDRKQAFECRGAAKVGDLVSQLEFDDADSGFHCMCFGDATVVFYKGKTKLVTLSHHHGVSLRWNDGRWKGDSMFTRKTARAWRTWFDAQGEPRFEKMHQERMAEAKLDRDIDAAFLKPFPAGAKAIFARQGGGGMVQFSPGGDGDEADVGKLSPAAEKLVGLFEDGAGLAMALCQSLGSLCSHGDREGSWSVSSSREQLVLEIAAHLSADDFMKVLEKGDDAALLGAARLFFFEDLSGILPAPVRAPTAAILAGVVLRADENAGNVDSAVRNLVSYPCAETNEVLEQLAGGKLNPRRRLGSGKREPQPRAAACLLLAQLGSGKVAELTAQVEALDGLDAMDRAALRIARALSGEAGLLDGSVFDIDSYTIGFGALAALEKEGGKKALDAIILSGTMASWAAIREESVLTAERMTGKKWYQGKKNERAEWHAKDIREWWVKARESYAAGE